MTNIVKKSLTVLFALVLAFPLALVPCAVSASPGTIYVPGDYPDIQSAIVEGTIDAIPEVTEATLTLNGNASTITVTDGEFSETVDLVDGENTIVVSATNVAGAGTSPTITVTLDTEAPPAPPSPSSTTNWWLIGGYFGRHCTDSPCSLYSVSPTLLDKLF